MAPKIYAPGGAKERQTPFGSVVRWGVKVDDLIAFAREHVNERGYINLDIVPRKDVGRYGETHSVVLDTYTKGSGQAAPSTAPAQRQYAVDPLLDRAANYERSPFDDDRDPFR